MKKLFCILITVFMVSSMIPVLSFSASVEGTWDGITATAPEGLGTQESPYLIASAENLYWMSQQIGSGTVSTDVVSNPFEGKYFVQTADIDLNGKSLAPIGYYYGDSSTMYVFGGTYNGQGYTIKNGTIISASGAEATVNWGTGMFGVIYGATIRNIVFDNITVDGDSTVGILVGRAATADYTDIDFNTIEKITVNSNCLVSNSCTSYSTGFKYIGQVGGIVGMAQGTMIKYCINSADITVVGNVEATGGIVGTVNGCMVSYCKNEGNLTLDAISNSNTIESEYGGIAGFILPIGASADDAGDVTISNCYNTGKFLFSGTSCGAAIGIGGILGGANQLNGKMTFKIENCYNLNEANSIDVVYDNIRVGGLVGTVWQPASDFNSTLYLTSSYSVEIIAGANQSGYPGTNEYRMRGNVNVYGNNEIVTDDVSTKSASEILVYTNTIDSKIANYKFVETETTTAAPETTTAAPETTTAAPETTTAAPETTTAAPETTTVEPETTTAAPETKDESSSGGCNSIIKFGGTVISTILLLSMIIVFRKKVKIKTN